MTTHKVCRVLFGLTMALAIVRAAAEERYARTELHMGVEFEVILYADDAEKANDTISRAMSRIAALDKALSDYDLDSELSKLSQTSVNSVAPPPVRGGRVGRAYPG